MRKGFRLFRRKKVSKKPLETFYDNFFLFLRRLWGTFTLMCSPPLCFSETGRIRLRRAGFQTPNSVSSTCSGMAWAQGDKERTLKRAGQREALWRCLGFFRCQNTPKKKQPIHPPSTHPNYPASPRPPKTPPLPLPVIKTHPLAPPSSSQPTICVPKRTH